MLRGEIGGCSFREPAMPVAARVLYLDERVARSVLRGAQTVSGA
jgi:hypothetical protein